MCSIKLARFLLSIAISFTPFLEFTLNPWIVYFLSIILFSCFMPLGIVIIGAVSLVFQFFLCLLDIVQSDLYSSQISVATFRIMICTRKWCRGNLRGLFLLIILALSSMIFVGRKYLDFESQSLTFHKPVACLRYKGRLGNLMFMYAFHYLFAKKKDFKMVKQGHFDLQDIFVLEDDKFMTDESFKKSNCSSLPVLNDRYDCGFDYELDLWPKRKEVTLDGYFQSWRYFVNNTETIRKLFIFREAIRTRAASKLHGILQDTKWNYKTEQLVGIHIRRGDHTDKIVIDFGKKVPTAKYIEKAMRYMTTLYGSVKFVVCSDDINWSRKHLGNFSNVYFSEGNTAAEDMALLTLTNHTIITVGTFGWWAAYLTNGTTIYFKDLFVPNSNFAAEFRNNSVEDFFPPSWIGFN